MTDAMPKLPPRVVVPYAGQPTPWTSMWAQAYYPTALPASVGGDVLGYGTLFAALWNIGEPFVIVEHDVVPWPGAVEELHACAEPWCAFAYSPLDGPLADHDGPPMGCAKFTPEGPVPFEAVTEIGEGGSRKGIPIWDRLDLTVGRSLRARGLTVHQHHPCVAHIRPPVRLDEEALSNLPGGQ